MLSGEGMERRKTGEKQQQVKLAKTAFARAAHFFCTFLCRCFARLQRESFFTAAHFDLALVATSISHFVTAATQNFHVVVPTKKMSPSVFHPSL